MYAVINTGGKQYRVAEGDTVRVEKLDAETGATVEFNDVLLVADGDNVRVGTPHVAGAKVTAEVVGLGKHPKVLIYKFRRRKGYRRKNGHRQPYTALKITAINA